MRTNPVFAGYVGAMEIKEEYLTYDELSAILKITARSCYKLKERGVLKYGVHWTHPPGLGVRFKKSAIIAWLEGEKRREQQPEQARPHNVTDIRMAKGYNLGG